jgi:hypothetical protein
VGSGRLFGIGIADGGVRLVAREAAHHARLDPRAAQPIDLWLTVSTKGTIRA